MIDAPSTADSSSRARGPAADGSAPSGREALYDALLSLTSRAEMDAFLQDL
ncbi:MAG: hypothetical protein ACK58O_03855 [Brevundimonas sp.]